MVCQYNRAQLAPEVLLAALHTHPAAIVGAAVHSNPFYEAPLILSAHGNGNGHPANGQAAARVEWMLGQLERARAAKLDRQERAARLLHLPIAREITDGKRADLIARHLSAVVESSDDAIISKDLNGIIKTWNCGAERMFGYTVREAIGKPISIIIPAEQHAEEMDVLNRIRSGHRIDHFETVRRRKDGSLVEISLTVSPIKDAEGQVIGASKIARDITLRKRAERELRAARDQLLEVKFRERTASLTEAISQMQEFSYTISHDLRAPARAVKSYAKIVLEDFGQSLPPRARDYLERIVRSGEQMDRLIQDILKYVRLTSGELELKPMSLAELISDIVQQYPQMQPPQAVITILNPLLDVRAHESSLAQALTNLLINAVKFMPPAEIPRITIRTEPCDGKVRLWIEDNGIGIKPQHQHRIFGIFVRLTTEVQYEGTGIGLAIVRKAVERMAGAVGVESDGVRGSRFWIELPRP
jgi:PAS domain S-box-containing protein